LKEWLDEYNADLPQVLRDAFPASLMPPTPGNAVEEKREPQFLNTAQIAARCQPHRGSVRRLLRGDLAAIAFGPEARLPEPAPAATATQAQV